MNRHLLLLVLLMHAIAPASAQKKYSYTSTPNDPLGLRIYTLGNGLQVWLSRNTDAPRVQTNICVRAGSKTDPADATGLAHYLEHMLFKGTSRIGTADWTKESELLRQISAAYERRRATENDDERAALYKRIDSLSTLAAAFAIPNEYDKMISSLGAKGTNAYTSTERTVYVNDVPSEELERWIRVEAERFRECVLRLFHTELETVYEEFNRSQDNDGRTANKAMNQLLYPNHPYGTQTTIGTGEHLKDPSMVKIMEYFSTYYVPNNMAVVLSGDIDYDRTVAMVDKYFGGFQRREVPPFVWNDDGQRSEVRSAEVFGPQAAWVELAWRFPGYDPEVVNMLALIDGMLNNGSAGLFDLDLVQAQQVLRASAYSYAQQDYSMLGLRGDPRKGQSLEEVRDLLLSEVEKLKAGDFDDWLIGAVVDDLRKRRTRSWTESNSARAGAMTDAFILGKNWQDVVEQFDRMARITRKMVIAFASENLNTNYCEVFKRTGENPDAHKVAKPSITQLDINRAGTSVWRKEWEKMPSAKLKPVFVDYATALTKTDLANGLPMYTVGNTVNDLFSLYYILEIGTDNDRELGVALRYLPYLGTSRLKPDALRKEFFKLGLSFDVNVTTDRTYVTLTGIEKNLRPGLELFEQVLADCQPNEQALQELVNDILKQRQDNMRNKNVLLNQALFNYARYGPVNPFNDLLTAEQLRELKPSELVERIRRLTSHRHRVFFYGSTPAADVSALLVKYHKVPQRFLPYPIRRPYPEVETTENNVLFLDHDMVQAEMLMVSKAEPFNRERMPYTALFNEYFGSGLSSIVFQEIREAKALAYGASANYTTPARSEDCHYVRVFIGTQSDKLGDAVAAMRALMNDMPMDETQFAGAKESALKVIASERIVREQLFWSWDAAQRRGMAHDVRRDIYDAIPAIKLADMKAFFDREIKGRTYTTVVIGRGSDVVTEALKELGPVRTLSKSEVFGYPMEKR